MSILLLFIVFPGSFSIECKTLLQYGTPRTGSTYQFTILNAINVLRENKWEISKTHEGQKSKRGTCLFVSRKKKSISDKWISEAGAIYVQEYDVFAAYPLHEIENYVPLFNLSKNEYNRLYTFMKYWSIVRRCCGSQSSIDYRNRIHGLHTLHHKFETVDYVDCDIYNISRVEELLYQTSVSKLMQGKVIIESKRPKAHLGFCKREEKKLKAGFDFNGIRWRNV